LVLAYALALHDAADAMSAQALTRSFAAATDAAWRNKQELLFVEPVHEGLDDPWDQLVPMLATARLANDRPWTGRMVKVKTVVGRYATTNTDNHP